MADQPTEILLSVTISPNHCRIVAADGMTSKMVQIAMELAMEMLEHGKAEVETKTFRVTEVKR